MSSQQHPCALRPYLLDCTLSAASENGRHQFPLQLMHLPALGWRRVIKPCQMEQPM